MAGVREGHQFRLEWACRGAQCWRAPLALWALVQRRRAPGANSLSMSRLTAPERARLLARGRLVFALKRPQDGIDRSTTSSSQASLHISDGIQRLANVGLPTWMRSSQAPAAALAAGLACSRPAMPPSRCRQLCHAQGPSASSTRGQRCRSRWCRPRWSRRRRGCPDSIPGFAPVA